jgi:hypothetical protein
MLRSLVPKYRNNFEKQTGLILGVSYEYESLKLPYVVHRNYIPDFINGKILIECKGFFRAGDTQKYKSIRNSIYPDGYELIFVLHNPLKKIRKNSKMNMGQWCKKEGFKFTTLEDINNVLAG